MQAQLRAFAAAVAVAALVATAAAAQTRLFADSRLVTLDRISVEVVGKGPDLILIPGLASSRETWRTTAERLRGRYRLHLVQVAGFAGEPIRGNKDGPIVAPVAEAIDGYIVQNRLAPAVLIGHSLGGTMSLYLAQKHPEHLKKVLLVDAMPLYASVLMRGNVPPPAQLHAIALQISQGMMAASDADYAKSLDVQMTAMATAPENKKTIAGWTLASDRTAVVRAMTEDLELDLRPGLATTSVPITLLYPDYGPVGVPAGGADAQYTSAYAAAPNKTLKRIDKSLHFIMYDQPEAFAAALDAFLAQ
jgi:pimeloyl-ACP methyl ester carboxylesterase